jgi:hypothetical protein
VRRSQGESRRHFIRIGAVGPGRPAANQSFAITVQDNDPLTNVAVTFCTPDSLERNGAATVGGLRPPYLYKFTQSAGLPDGRIQVAFRADPSDKIYATTEITISK